MNDSDRGPGHGITQGALYGLVFLSLEMFLSLLFPLWAVGICWALLALLNHARALYQELVVEGWNKKAKAWDFWFDAIFRPLQSDALSLLIFLPQQSWGLWII